MFVFAITQLSHYLLDHLDATGAARATFLLLVVWWSWNYTTWVTNELDPESPVVRLLMIALMLASLLMAVAIPHAFGDDALLFAGSYVAIQVGRHLFLTFVAGERGTLARERAGRILIWFVASGVLWLAGAVADDGARTVLWLAALLVDYGAPVALFWVPGMRHLHGEDWDVETSHFSERFGLFIIIALGESIVLTGATASELGLDGARVAAFSVAFLSTAALWWLYFTATATRAEHDLEHAAHRTTMARDAYTYLHVVLVAGIVLSAVGDELVIAHPRDPLTDAEAAAVVGGPALYLLGHALFSLRLSGHVSWRRLGGAVGCCVIGVLGAAADADALPIAVAVLAVLGVVIGLEQRAAGGRALAPAVAQAP